MKKIVASFLPNVYHYGPLLMALGILALLLARNPFSLRTLIPNFEPYPDSFHYVTTSRCFLQGQGWLLCRPDVQGVTPAVPPLYSAAMMPFFLIYNDPRMFYFANVTLAIISVWLLWRILTILKLNTLIQFFILGIYVTTYYVYWLPVLAMAENTLLPLFLAAVLLFILPKSRKHLYLAAIIVPSLYGTKYAALPLMGIFWWAFVLKYITFSLNKKNVQNFFWFSLITGGLYLLYGGWQTIATTTASTEAAGSTDSWFSYLYWPENVSIYLKALSGHPTKFLWHHQALLPSWLSGLGWLGLLIAGVQKKFSPLAWLLMTLSLGQVAVLALFYTVDARYIITSLPSLLLGVALCLEWLYQVRKDSIWRICWLLFVCLLGIAYLLFQVKPLRTQLALNLKYAETPWWYISVQELNHYFSQNSATHQPYVATLISPYYLDFFGNHRYQPLPLWPEQDFKGHKEKVWGIPQIEALPDTYQRLLTEGADVYLFSYGLHVYQTGDEYRQTLLERFHGRPVFTGCAGACTLYKLSL
ncbi:MAG TPA: hypothetical protein VF209_04365 [Patescibacteria group bacterium]